MGKVAGILSHWGVLLILASSWARPAILVAGKGIGNVFISSVSSLSFTGPRSLVDKRVDS